MRVKYSGKKLYGLIEVELFNVDTMDIKRGGAGGQDYVMIGRCPSATAHIQMFVKTMSISTNIHIHIHFSPQKIHNNLYEQNKKNCDQTRARSEDLIG